MAAPFAPVAGGPDAPERTEAGPRQGSPAPPNKTRNTTGPAATMAPESARCCQPIGNGSPQGKRERNKRKKGKAKKRGDNKPTSPQAHKERDTPPPIARGRQPFPSSQIRAKKSAKSRLGVVLKKFSEKFFVGMFRGERKTPCVISTEGGCLTNENREISNLAMQITKNAQKHYLITEGKGR